MAGAAPKSSALWVVRTLRRAGYEALWAGGCVRDMLLGRACTDYDVATSATPRQVKRLFPRVLLVGAKFGVAMVLRDARKVEVATFRSDLSYADGRRPEGVRFATAREDALRRDFTINGMFYDPVAREVIDHVGGRADLQRRVVRTIGQPRDRFGEDYLRMLRAVRFAVGLSFTLDAPAAEAIRELAPRVERISGERVFEELWKMLQKPSAAGALRMLADVGLAPHVLPELFAGKNRDSHLFSSSPQGRNAGLEIGDCPYFWDRAVARVQAVAGRKDPLLSLAALVWELPAPVIARLIRRGGQSNDLRESLTWLAGHRDGWPAAPAMPLAGFKRLLAHRDFARLHHLWAVEERRQTGAARACAGIHRRARSIPPQKVSPPPLVTGAHLKTLGLAEGPRLGEVLRRLYDAQLNEEISTPEEGLALAKRLLD